jgi:branched-chain amino acid transport system ATP-binding protein
LQTDHRGGPENLRDFAREFGLYGQRQPASRHFGHRHLRTYTADLKKHIRTEEKHVMPLARKVLLKADWQEINRAFLDNSDPLFGESGTGRVS